MKKIGLLTFHNNTNYGSWLQTYALYKVVHDLDYEIEVIDYRSEKDSYMEIISMSNFSELLQDIKIEKLSAIKNVLKIQVNFKNNKRKYWKLSNLIYTEKNVEKLNKEYDIFLIGSDLVWDIRYAGSHTYMLNFAHSNKKRISYAASYGYETIPEKEKKFFKKYLLQFQKITVREKNSKEELTKLLNMPVEYVCDPTMLLENSEWKKFVKPNKRKNKYVLVYMPDNKKKIVKEARRYCRKYHCDILIISKTKEKDSICPYSIEEFLSLFYYAEKIFTGSYHGLVFSVYFEKEFAYINRMPANRMQSLAEKLGLDQYEINNPVFDLEKKIDYVPIKEKEQEFRHTSKKILEEMLKDAI